MSGDAHVGFYERRGAKLPPATRLGMSRSTTHRYVITLVALGYLEQGASRKYRLGCVPRTQKEVDVERTDGCDAA
jgi:hypothetical protein